MSKTKRAWLLLTVSGDANAKAEEIWEDTNMDKSVIDAYKDKDKFPDIVNLKLGWVVRADVIDGGQIMVPVVGELKKKSSTYNDPIALIVNAIEKVHEVAVTRFDVTEHKPMEPDKGNHNPPKKPKKDDSGSVKPRPLNAWG